MNVNEAVRGLDGSLTYWEKSGKTFISVQYEELSVLVEWAKARLAENPGQFYVGDKVKLAVTGDPEEEDEPETGVVIGRSGPGYLVRPDAGRYADTEKGLYYGPHEVSAFE